MGDAPGAPRGELRALTSVRGIAAWFVVFYHIRESVAGLGGWPLAIVAHGYLAVDFFFLLSGFVLWLSYAERLRSGGLRVVPGFLQRRFARIWPLHAVVLSGGVALALLLAATGRHDPVDFPFAELPLHYLLVQNWGFTRALAWNDPAWSISVETAAYLLFPLLAFAIDWRRLPSWTLLGMIAVLLAALHAVFAAAGSDSLNADIPRFGLLRCLIEFSMGTIVCALWLRWRGSALVARVAAGLALAALAAVAAGWAPETLLVPVCFAAALLALALTSGARNPLEAAPLHWLGELSYATYLCHFLLWKAFKLAFVAAPGPVGWPLIALYLALVLAASAALYGWVERPAQRWLNAAAPKFRRPSESWGLPR
ncbi:acyltransferase [Sphingomonas sp. S1-29]|uniref:acyltransferase family protein n=1 Tax=Sphingomonas sp. S1-29 TaxID=2991074 RepID=UPI00223E9C45|nr:acyltransferase [Sphingomonas sp. S1-29]UZK70938.1 acyltransferase [Sphingomonas sp. S1-29]